MLGKYLWCVLGLILAGCGGPVYTSTIYTPPQTPGGRVCMDECNKARDYCQETCDLEYRSCYNDVQTAAQAEYDTYAREQFSNHQAASRFPSDFEHPEACQATKKSCVSDCTKPYDSCYHACGGQVTTTTSCQFLCFE